jgi:hypothetical protein
MTESKTEAALPERLRMKRREGRDLLTPALVHSLDGPPFASNCTELNGRRTSDECVARVKRFQGAGACVKRV